MSHPKAKIQLHQLKNLLLGRDIFDTTIRSHTGLRISEITFQHQSCSGTFQISIHCLTPDAFLSAPSSVVHEEIDMEHSPYLKDSLNTPKELAIFTSYFVAIGSI